MGVMDRFTGFSSTVVPKEVVVALTPLGEEKVNQASGEGAAYKVMIILNERGPCDLDELSKATGFGVDKLRHIINRQLSPKSYVRRVN